MEARKYQRDEGPFTHIEVVIALIECRVINAARLHSSKEDTGFLNAKSILAFFGPVNRLSQELRVAHPVCSRYIARPTLKT